MKNLGKVLILIFLIPLSLMAREVANVVASVDSSDVQRGEMVTYEMMVDGDNIVRPTIATLCGQNVISTGSQTSIQMINGTMTKSYIFTYKFLPQKSCVIKPIEVEIDSKILKTNSVKVNVSKLKIQKNSPFILTLESDRNQVYVGEPFELKLLFKQRNGAEAIDSEFIAPNFKGFWIKEESKASRYKKDGYTITEKNYKLAAQRIGELKISSAEMRIAYRTHTRDPWAGVISRIKWRSYYSNEVKISAKAIPNGVSLVGDFSISAEIDKNSINANEAVNVNIRVLGEGNLEDIESFKPYVTGVNVFEEKIETIGNKLTQKIVFVSDKDFTIPSFELVYFDTQTQKVKKITTQPIDIKVVGAALSPQKLEIKRDSGVYEDMKKSVTQEEESKKDYLLILIAFFIGLLLGVVSVLLLKSKREKKTTFKFDIKNEKALLVRLLPYKESDTKVAEIIAILEENIYTTKKIAIDKKVLKEILTKYKIS